MSDLRQQDASAARATGGVDAALPLAGVRILEIDAIGPLPLAAMLLAGMGADVVRIARPPLAGHGAWDDVGGAILHRGRSVTHLDLKNTADRDRLLALVERADALIEGYRPGVMERLGVGPDICLARNPQLVFARMTGWGQAGPLAPRAGHDLNYIALTGALHAMGNGVDPPPVPLNLVGDYGGGSMFLIAGLLAGVLSARQTGKGTVVDACIVDGVATLLSLFLAWLPGGRWTDAPASNLLDGAAPFYRCYACADGRHVAVGALEPQFFAQLIAGLGLGDRVFDQGDRAGWPAMQAVFAETFATRTRDAWHAHFVDSDACVTAVLSLQEAATDPHMAARGSYVRDAGLIAPAPAPRFGSAVATIPPEGTATIEEVLQRWS